MHNRATGSNFRVFSKNYVFDPRPNLPFRITAKRYRMDPSLGDYTNSSMPELSDGKMGKDTLTLIFAHALGFHKEHWEPTIHRLFQHQQVSKGCSFQIQDMWSLDAPNHGDAAVMNERVFSFGYQIFPWEDYARSVHAFLAGLGDGVDIDFSRRNLVAVGHSLGTVAAMLSTTFFPSIKFSSMHLVEPVMLGNYDRDFISSFGDRAENRRDTWDSAEDAYMILKSRPTWQKWDDRILRIYVEHGLRPLSATEYPDRKSGVTLKCTRRQEAAAFRDRRSGAIAYRLLPHLLRKIPTHVTYGEMADLVPAEYRDDALNNASGGIEKFASVSWVSGAGHLVVQSHPDAVADVIWRSLLQTHSKGQRCDDASPVRI